MKKSLLCLFIVCFPFPAILVKVVLNGLMYLVTGELNESY